MDFSGYGNLRHQQHQQHQQQQHQHQQQQQQQHINNSNNNDGVNNYHGYIMNSSTGIERQGLHTNSNPTLGTTTSPFQQLPQNQQQHAPRTHVGGTVDLDKDHEDLDVNQLTGVALFASEATAEETLRSGNHQRIQDGISASWATDWNMPTGGREAQQNINNHFVHSVDGATGRRPVSTPSLPKYDGSVSSPWTNDWNVPVGGGGEVGGMRRQIHSNSPPPGFNVQAHGNGNGNASANNLQTNESKLFGQVPNTGQRRLRNMFLSSDELPTYGTTKSPSIPHFKTLETTVECLEEDSKEATSLEKEMEELKEIILMQKKAVKNSNSLLNNSTKSIDKSLNIDQELDRLSKMYKPPNAEAVDVDALLEQVTEHKPFDQGSSGAGTGAGAGAGAGAGGATRVMGRAQRPIPQRRLVRTRQIQQPQEQQSIHNESEQRNEQIVLSLKTVPGSQRVQKLLDKLLKLKNRPNHPDYPRLKAEASQVLEAIKGQIGKLLTHRSANYAVSKLFETLDDEERLVFLQDLKNRVSRVCRHQHGTFAVQKIIATIKDQEQMAMLVQGLSQEVRTLAKDQHATFTLQRILSSPLKVGKSDLFEAFVFQGPSHDILPEHCDFIAEVALEKHGAMFLTFLMRNCSSENFVEFVQVILPNFVQIACDMYGNYVAQLALENSSTCSLTSSDQASQLLSALIGRDEVLLQVARDEFGVKVLLSALALKSWIRAKISNRLFACDDISMDCQNKEQTHQLMFNSHSSTLLKRALKLETSPSKREQFLNIAWNILNTFSVQQSVEHDKWVHFLERLPSGNQKQK